MQTFRGLGAKAFGSDGTPDAAGIDTDGDVRSEVRGVKVPVF